MGFRKLMAGSILIMMAQGLNISGKAVNATSLASETALSKGGCNGGQYDDYAWKKEPGEKRCTVCAVPTTAVVISVENGIWVAQQLTAFTSNPTKTIAFETADATRITCGTYAKAVNSGEIPIYLDTIYLDNKQPKKQLVRAEDTLKGDKGPVDCTVCLPAVTKAAEIYETGGVWYAEAAGLDGSCFQIKNKDTGMTGCFQVLQDVYNGKAWHRKKSAPFDEKVMFPVYWKDGTYVAGTEYVDYALKIGGNQRDTEGLLARDRTRSARKAFAPDKRGAKDCMTSAGVTVKTDERADCPSLSKTLLGSAGGQQKLSAFKREGGGQGKLTKFVCPDAPSDYTITNKHVRGIVKNVLFARTVKEVISKTYCYVCFPEKTSATEYQNNQKVFSGHFLEIYSRGGECETMFKLVHEGKETLAFDLPSGGFTYGGPVIIEESGGKAVRSRSLSTTLRRLFKKLRRAIMNRN